VPVVDQNGMGAGRGGMATCRQKIERWRRQAEAQEGFEKLSATGGEVLEAEVGVEGEDTQGEKGGNEGNNVGGGIYMGAGYYAEDRGGRGEGETGDAGGGARP